MATQEFVSRRVGSSRRSSRSPNAPATPTRWHYRRQLEELSRGELPDPERTMLVAARARGAAEAWVAPRLDRIAERCGRLL